MSKFFRSKRQRDESRRQQRLSKMRKRDAKRHKPDAPAEAPSDAVTGAASPDPASETGVPAVSESPGTAENPSA